MENYPSVNAVFSKQGEFLVILNLIIILKKLSFYIQNKQIVAKTRITTAYTMIYQK
jgi:hypothetical protein